jgi:hypothetical protein
VIGCLLVDVDGKTGGWGGGQRSMYDVQNSVGCCRKVK